MVNELLANLVDSVLGKGKRTSKGNYAYVCPFHISNPPGKKNFEINFTVSEKGLHPWHCWACDAKGKSMFSLFKKLNVSEETLQKLKAIVKEENYTPSTSLKDTIVKLPDEFKSLINSSSLTAKHALIYLKKRNITIDDIETYNIGYCEEGLYKNMIIIPSYDSNGLLNFFTGRSFFKDAPLKYKNPEYSRNIIPFELFINWDLPIILCEGPFDAIAIKRNAIPLLGKNIQSALMKKIISSNVKKIYIALDKDAIKQSLKFCEYFMNENKEVYLVELEEKDPSEMGFYFFTNLIQQSIPLTPYDLMGKKLELV